MYNPNITMGWTEMGLAVDYTTTRQDQASRPRVAAFAGVRVG